MKRKWNCYWEEHLEGEKIPKRAILFATMKSFSSLCLSLLPSVDEEDRKLAVQKRLEERFVDTDKLSFLYIELLEEQGHSELVFCCYSEKEKEFPSSFLYVIPEVLLGKLLKQEQLFLLSLYRGKYELYRYEKQKLLSYEKLSLSEFKVRYEEEIRQCSEGECLVLGEEELDPSLLGIGGRASDYTSLLLSSIPSEIDFFQGERQRKRKQKNILHYAPYGLSFLLVATIALGFFWEYRMEQYKEVCKELEEKKLSSMFALQELEKEIQILVEEREAWEQEKQKNRNVDQKISEILLKIYRIREFAGLNTLECLEDEQIRMEFFFYSFQDYLDFFNELVAQGFHFENHDSIEREKQKYKMILEFREEEDEKE